LKFMIFRELQTVPLLSAENESFFRMLAEILISSVSHYFLAECRQVFYRV